MDVSQVDPRIDSLFRPDRPLRSVEFFPPKDEAGMDALRETAAVVVELKPDFVSVTYGAGGGTRRRTDEVTTLLRETYGLVVMPHLTCVNHDPTEVLDIVAAHHRQGIRNIMALRGDVPKDSAPDAAFRDGLRHGSDIVRLIHKHFPDICCGVAGYPETHPEAASPETDIRHLREKVESGGAFVTTQLFFDNAVFHRFVDRCRNAGIGVPILPGIMPALSLAQIRRMTALSGSAVPAELEARLASFNDDPEAARTIGINWAVAQIDELARRGVPGCHLYVLNRAASARELIGRLAG